MNFFKKSLAVFSSILTAGLLIVSPLSVSAADYRNGDINGDSTLNIYDTIGICNHVMGGFKFDEDALKRADYNKDKSVNIYDAIFVSRFILCSKNLNEVVDIINMTRGYSNAAPLELDNSMVDAAMKRASELPIKPVGNFRPDNSGFETIFAEYEIEYSECANCIAAVPATPKELCSAILEREDVTKRLLNQKYTKIGVGYYSCNDEYKHYWAILLV